MGFGFRLGPTRARPSPLPLPSSLPLQTPVRYAASKLASNAAFFAKGARMVVKSVADRVAKRGGDRRPSPPATTGEPAGFMQGHNDGAADKYAAMADKEAAARAQTGNAEPLTGAYPEAVDAARATAGVDKKEKE